MVVPLAPILATAFSRLMASRIGVGAVQAARGMRGGAGSFLRATATGGMPAPVAQRQAQAQRPTIIQQILQRVRAPRSGTPPAGQPSLSRIVAQAGGQTFGNIMAGRASAAQVAQQQQQQQQQSGQQNAVASSMFGRVFNSPVKAGLGLVGVFAALTIAGKKLADTQVDHLRNLRRFNGQIAAAYARLTRGELMRTRASAARLGGSTEALTNAVNQMRDATQPIKDLLTVGLNYFGAAAAKIVTILSAGAAELPGIKELLAKIEGKDGQGQMPPWQNTLNDLAQEYRTRYKPKRP